MVARFLSFLSNDILKSQISKGFYRTFIADLGLFLLAFPSQSFQEQENVLNSRLGLDFAACFLCKFFKTLI